MIRISAKRGNRGIFSGLGQALSSLVIWLEKLILDW